MSRIDVLCTLVRVDGKLVGVGLASNGQTEGEYFCRSVYRHLRDGNVKLKVGGGKLRFIDKVFEKAEVAFAVTDIQERELRTLFKSWKQMHMVNARLFGPAFLFVLRGTKGGTAERLSFAS